MSALKVPTLLVALLLAGCRTTGSIEGAPLEAVQRRGFALEAAREAQVAELLKDGLDAERALAVALRRSPQVAALEARWGIAQAEWVQAGRLPNPELGLSLAIEAASPLGWGVGLMQPLAALLLLPTTLPLSEAERRAAQAEVAGALLELRASIQAEVVGLQALEAELALLDRVVAAEAAAVRLAELQHHAGNLTDWELDQSRVLLDTVQVARIRLATAAGEAHAALASTLGLYGEEAAFRLKPLTLPASEGALPEPAELEARALGQRFELEGATAVVERAERLRSFVGVARWLPGLSAGVEVESDHGARHLRPTLALELPLFDPGDARAAKARFELGLAEAMRQRAAIAIRAEVRGARIRLAGAEAFRAQVRDVLLPRRIQLVTHTLQQYDAMQVGAAVLLQAKQAEFEAERSAVEATRELLLARIALERATALPLFTPRNEAVETTPSKELQP